RHLPRTTLFAYTTLFRSGSATDQDGKFLIDNVPAGNHTLVVSSVGYGKVTRSVTVIAGEATSVDIRLVESVEQLQAVEITGRKEDRKSTRLNSSHVKRSY